MTHRQPLSTGQKAPETNRDINIPPEINAWLRETSAPRRCGGVASAMYIGTVMLANPRQAQGIANV